MENPWCRMHCADNNSTKDRNMKALHLLVLTFLPLASAGPGLRATRNLADTSLAKVPPVEPSLNKVNGLTAREERIVENEEGYCC
jgi:hypothetical protein